MAQKTLFAWAVPAFIDGSPADHTWVTTFDHGQTTYPDANAVAAAGESNWFCWGAYHASGGTPGNPTGALGSQAGDVALASCIAAPNEDSRSVAAARGTIFVYGVDGVCHQLANQVLYSTGQSGQPPLTVKAARFYIASAFVYGTYGLQHAAWTAKVQKCSGGALPSGLSVSGISKMPDLKDDFDAHAHAVLGSDEPELLGKLLVLKGEVHNFAATAMPGFAPPNAETLNARNQHLIDQAAILLGPEKFERVFGFPPDQKVLLVNPSLLRR